MVDVTVALDKISRVTEDFKCVVDGVSVLMALVLVLLFL
jgi:hypothetical protein